jgi:DNA helicase HerA-like ATPase
MTIIVGEVIGVAGVTVSLRIFEESSKEVLFFRGISYKGVSIRGYLCIQRGFRNIVCIVEGEYLDEKRSEVEGVRVEFVRRVQVRPIGYFEGGVFHHGIKFMPMIKDAAILLSEDEVASVYGSTKSRSGLSIGRMLKEEIEVELPWSKLFNSHIGIFGNTGSGKSNTLAKLYTALFERKFVAIERTSRFIVIDFNGEYTGNQLLPAGAKAVYALNTQDANGARFPLAPSEFWDTETLAVLFQATSHTQRPFLNRLVQGRNRYQDAPNALTNYTRLTFKTGICAAKARGEALDLLRGVARLIASEPVRQALEGLSWHSGQYRFFRPADGVYFDADGNNYDAHLGPIIEQIDVGNLDAFEQLELRAHLQLVRELSVGYVQFDHIQPLLKRIESSLGSLRRVLDVRDLNEPERVVTVISLKRCNNDVKKTLPLLLAKHFYNSHKARVAQPPERTIHLIIDEAHNILSLQSNREQESWKDYRLEQFEEIIKEGRKFGVFITLASQRPADISPTIVSQVHNFFIHRLVNDRDLALIENTLTTLDSLSRGLIPSLAQGSCVATGTAFDVPMVLQVDRLAAEHRPASDDVDLTRLWRDQV